MTGFHPDLGPIRVAWDRTESGLDRLAKRAPARTINFAARSRTLLAPQADQISRVLEDGRAAGGPQPTMEGT